eukprot:s691_g11.t1
MLRNLFQTKRELTSLKWQYDQLMADRDQSLQKAANVEAALKSADLRQADLAHTLLIMTLLAMQDAAKAAEVRATGFEEQAANLRHTVYRLESELGHQRAIAMIPREVRGGAPSPGLWGLSGKLAQVLALLDASSLEEGLRRLRAECEDLKAGLPSRPGLQETVNPVDLEFADIHLRKQHLDLEQRLRHVQDKSKLSELEMLMQGIETEQEALHGHLEASQARAVNLESQVVQEEIENRRLRSEMLASQTQAEKLQRQAQRHFAKVMCQPDVDAGCKLIENRMQSTSDPSC